MSNTITVCLNTVYEKAVVGLTAPNPYQFHYFLLEYHFHFMSLHHFFQERNPDVQQVLGV
jgi:hypothetical protein